MDWDEMAPAPPGGPTRVAALLMTANAEATRAGINTIAPRLFAVETAPTVFHIACNPGGPIAIPARIHVVTAQAA